MNLAVCGSLLLLSCADPTPPIAQGLPTSSGPTPDFDARIKQRFPVGSSEGSLVAELRSENFGVTEIRDPASQFRHQGYYEAHIFPCKATWTIKWFADQGLIAGIEGRNSGQLCL
jgi:hypothetical protein